MRCASLSVRLGNGHPELLEHVDKGAGGNFLPLDGRFLRCGHHIPNGGVHLLYGVGSAAADGNVIEAGNALRIGGSVLIHPLSAQRSAVEVKSYTLHQTVFGILDQFQTAFLQLILKLDGGLLPLKELEGLGGYRHILFRDAQLLCDIGDAVVALVDGQAVQRDLALAVGGLGG